MAVGLSSYTSFVIVSRYWRRTFSSIREANGCFAEVPRIIFLGTPQVAAIVLQELLTAAAAPSSYFQVAAVVSRPSSRQWLEREQQAAGAFSSDTTALNKPASAQWHPGHPVSPGGTAVSATAPGGLQLQSFAGMVAPGTGAPNWSRHGASAVERQALHSGIPSDCILCPVSAKEPAFLEAVRRLRPALAITAAYGAMLPQSFLDIPKYGTINIHPSLLPRYRGAAPVQRALQDGCATTGVSLAFTVLKCDAGPVLEQQEVPIPPDVQAPELSEQLFRLGAAMLLRHLPRVLAGELTAAQAAPQDEAAATYAPKIVKQEAYLDFRRPAVEVHNHVRAMAGWPGSRASLLLEDRATGTRDPLELKVLRTRVAPPPPPPPAACPASPVALPPGTSAQVLCTPAGELLIPCGDGNMLSVLEVGRRPGSGSPSSPAAKCLGAKDFIAGLGRRRLFLPSRT